MIKGVHTMFFSSEPEALREFLRDKLGFPFTDIGGGWLMVTYAPSLGCLGPWIAASAFIIVAAVFLWWRWHSRIWMGVDLFRVDAGGSDESPASGGVCV